MKRRQARARRPARLAAKRRRAERVRAHEANAQRGKPIGYLERLILAASRRPEDLRGVTHIFVEHDDWCQLYSGRGRNCTCTPNLRQHHPDGSISKIELDGSVVIAGRMN